MQHPSLNFDYVETVSELPKELFSEIGRIIVWYAYLEAHLSQVIQFLLNISEQESRIAMRDPRATARLEIIEDLLLYNQISVSVSFKPLWKRLDDIQKKRNLLSHNCWVEHPETKELLLGLVRGKRTDHPEIDRKFIPEGVPFGIDQCKALSKEIDDVNEIVCSLKSQIFDALPALKKKYELQFPQHNQNQDYIPLAHTPPPQSSEG